ncbi:MAG TPA: hypothetical protein PLV44_12230 [Myxococcota bacterium]|nr:hypothetical protein [Myxococcota bacterium]HRT29905.1 hypothetical protein [Kiritimatiellia bacterium]
MTRKRKWLSFFLLQFIVFACCIGCTQKRVVCHEAQLMHEDEEIALVVKQRLRRIIIPEFEIGPPKTLVDAIYYFSEASRNHEDPKIPIEERGVSFVLKLRASGEKGHLADNEDPFTAPISPQNNAPVIPKMSARFISLYDAISLVCDTTGYTFDLRNGFVLIAPGEDDVEPVRPDENSR